MKEEMTRRNGKEMRQARTNRIRLLVHASIEFCAEDEEGEPTEDWVEEGAAGEFICKKKEKKERMKKIKQTLA